jgi:hypothetical protein
MDADGVLVPKAELLKQFRSSDASERRRSGAADWPTNVLIGSKVYYRRSQIDAWARRREVAAGYTADEATFELLVHHAREVADRASSLKRTTSSAHPEPVDHLSRGRVVNPAVNRPGANATDHQAGKPTSWECLFYRKRPRDECLPSARRALVAEQLVVVGQRVNIPTAERHRRALRRQGAELIRDQLTDS